MNTDLSRRTFLKQAGLAGAAIGFPAVVRAASPNSKVQIAAVGVDGMGFSDLRSIVTHPKAQYVGFCDIDSTHFGKADGQAPGVPHFADFRAMLEKLGNSVDAVNIAIPDHMHAIVAVEAMKRGKHVYCQKPLAHTVWEVRQMRKWAEKKNVVTQMGNQIHSGLVYRLAVRLIQDGAIGKVREVHSWVGVTGNERTRLLEPPQSSGSKPSINWENWIGGAPMRPYEPDLYHPFAWRDWQDFGGGALGDFGCHILDPVFTALGLKAPLTVTAENTGINRHIWPTAETVRYVFPGNPLTAESTLKVTWTDGGLRPTRKLAQLPADVEMPNSGSLFIGEAGNMVLPHFAAPRLYPQEKFQGFVYPKDVVGLNHWHTWVDAIIEGRKTSDGFHYAGPLAETVQLGNVATRVPRIPRPGRGKREMEVDALTPAVLEWDAENFRIKNHPAANALLTKTYRRGWEVTPA
jgi:predicted dehydrogenase